MDIKFSKESDDSQQVVAENKGKQGVLLVVLLILAGVFAYLYFFTGLIKPLPEQKVAVAPPASPQVIKQPLPSPESTPPKPAGESTKEAGAPPATQPAPVVAAAPVAAAKPATPEAAKPKETAKSAGETLPAVKKPLPASGKDVAGKTAPVAKKQAVVAENKPQTAKVAEKKPAETKKLADVKKPAEVKKAAELKKPVKKLAATGTPLAKVKNAAQKPARKEIAAAPPKTAATGKWTVQIGNYVLEEALASDLARVRKAGLNAYVVPGPQKKTHMNRLLLAEFTDRAAAQAELARLKHTTSDAFIIDSAGMFDVYAGSYLLDTRAASEKERLAAAGFKLTVKRADVPIPTRNLTAGSFAEKSAAEAVLKKLRSAGIKATLSRQ
ncbi:MAG: SPOR domain-containing protein [Desulfobacteraceae bacterium]|nr:SPOR domain-containing protein [Desulfobacteraceae bacterium]